MKQSDSTYYTFGTEALDKAYELVEQYKKTVMNLLQDGKIDLDLFTQEFQWLSEPLFYALPRWFDSAPNPASHPVGVAEMISKREELGLKLTWLFTVTVKDEAEEQDESSAKKIIELLQGIMNELRVIRTDAQDYLWSRE